MPLPTPSPSPHQLFTVIYGPTASGKTAHALQLARQRGANILSFDSRQVYQHMDVVTGKDIPPEFTPQTATTENSFLPYSNGSLTLYGFDAVSPTEDWSVAHFYQAAAPIIAAHRAHQQPLILVGGSWPYAAALFAPPESLLVPQNPPLRQQLANETLPTLQEKVRTVAPQRWQDMSHSDQNNPRRLIRTLEVATADTPLAPALFSPEEAQFVFFTAPLQTLEKNIRQRVEARLQTGALEETQHLMDTFPHWETPAFSATGYTFIRQFLENKISQEELVEKWTQQERQYAKKQRTWLTSLINRFPDADIISLEQETRQNSQPD